MDTINLKLYDILKSDFKLSDAKARAFAEAIKIEIQNDIKAENTDFRSNLREDFLKIDIKLEQLRSEIKESKSDVVKWVAAILIGQTAVIVTLVKLLKFI